MKSIFASVLVSVVVHSPAFAAHENDEYALVASEGATIDCSAVPFDYKPLVGQISPKNVRDYLRKCPIFRWDAERLS